jgi:hypothetical protein
MEYCEHTGKKEPRKKIYTNGILHVVLQCQTCGKNIRSLKKADHNIDEVLWFDDELQKDWTARYMAAWEERASAKNREWDTRREEIKSDYRNYLDSNHWRRRREIVMRYYNGKCSALLPGCSLHATEVHHTTYDHAGCEPLFELKPCCSACHAKIHEMDDNGVLTAMERVAQWVK